MNTRRIVKIVLSLFVVVFLSTGCTAALATLAGKPNTKTLAPAVNTLKAPAVILDGEVSIRIKTYNEPELAEIMKVLSGIYGEADITYDAFRDKSGRLVITKKIQYSKNGVLSTEITIFDGEIVSIKSDRGDLLDKISGTESY